MRKYQLTMMIQREEDGYVSLCPEFDIASQGETVAEAKQNLIEALEGFLEVAPAEEIATRLAAERRIEPLEVSVG